MQKARYFAKKQFKEDPYGSKDAKLSNSPLKSKAFKRTFLQNHFFAKGGFPIRIVSLCPSNTELLENLGLLHDLVGVDDFSDWPESIAHLPRLGPDLSIRMDEVEQLNPDLVLASLSVPGMEKNVEALKERGLPFVVYNPQSFSDIIEDLRDLGKRCNAAIRAEQSCQAITSALDYFREKSSLILEKPSVYFEWWPKPIFTPGRLNWLTEMCELAGGINIFSDVELASVQTTWEDVLHRNPSHIVMAWVGVKTSKMNAQLLQKRPDWETSRAIQQDQVHIVEEPYFCRPSPRLLIGLKQLAAILHPDVFPAEDLEKLQA